jgi:hypothetical protein
MAGLGLIWGNWEKGCAYDDDETNGLRIMGGGFAQDAQIQAKHPAFGGLEQARCSFPFHPDQPFGDKAACP